MDYCFFIPVLVVAVASAGKQRNATPLSTIQSAVSSQSNELAAILLYHQYLRHGCILRRAKCIFNVIQNNHRRRGRETAEGKFGSKESHRRTSAARFAPIRLPQSSGITLRDFNIVIRKHFFTSISVILLEKTKTKPFPRPATIIFQPNGHTIVFETERSS